MDSATLAAMGRVESTCRIESLEAFHIPLHSGGTAGNAPGARSAIAALHERPHAAAWRLWRTPTSGDGMASTDCRHRARRRAVVLDGVFSVLSEAGDHEVSFHEERERSPTHIQQLEATVQRRVLRQFARRGLLDEAATDDILGWQGSGGFSVDAGVRIEGEDRAHPPRAARAPGQVRPAPAAPPAQCPHRAPPER